MPNDNTTTDENTTQEQTTEYIVEGWADLAPSCTITVPADKSIEDIPDAEILDALREELERMGHDSDEFGIEIHDVHEKW